MTVSPKMKKILAIAGGATLFVVCAIAMTKCNSNGNARDAANEDLAAQTARADSLQQLLTRTEENRQGWISFAEARGDTIRMLREDSTLGDSIVVLNDSIEHLVAANDSLSRQLNDCRGRRAARNKQPKRSNNNGQAASSQGRAQVTTGGSNVVVVPAAANTTVNVNGGCGNTVNVNNGTVNNYYAPAPENKTVDIESSASVTTTYVVKVKRGRCK